MNQKTKSFKMYCTAILLMAYWLTMSAFADGQTAGSFPREIMSERMERIQEMGRETNQTLSFDYAKMKDE